MKFEVGEVYRLSALLDILNPTTYIYVLVRISFPYLATGQIDLGSEMDQLDKETDEEEKGLGNEELGDGEC